jgi:ubiquinone/menaquinone biosynthesis C-methylase UbiE
MKKKTVPSTRSESYWKEDAVSFASLYGKTHGGTAFSRIVAGFLSDRSKTLMRMIGDGRFAAVLDVGCGSGIHMRMLAPRTTRVCGIDYSAQMIAEAKHTLADVPAKTWNLAVADAASLPHKNGQFDLVIAMGLLDYVPSPEAVLRECRRVMAAKSVLVVSLPKNPSVFSFLRSGIGNAIKKRVFNLPPIDNALSREELETLFARAGLTVVDTDDVWDAMWMVKAVPRASGTAARG